MIVAIDSLDPFVRRWVTNVLTSVGKGDRKTIDTRLIKHIQYAKSVETLRMGFRNVFARRFRILLSDAGKQAAHLYTAHHSATPIVNYVNSTLKKSTTNLFQNLYVTVAKSAGQHAHDQLVRRAKATYEYDPMTDPEMVKWMKRAVGSRIDKITKSSADKVRDIVTKGIKDGWSVEDVANELDNTFTWGGARSTRIAQTEVVSASNAGSHFAILTNVGTEGVTKIWMSLPDDRTRDSHEEADEQRRPIDEPFDVGSSELMFPGDDSLGAGPEELVNCRCTQSYEVEPLEEDA